MKTSNNATFYAQLPANNISVTKLLADERLFSGVPEDWHIVVTDIKGSTQAVAEGRHQDVNLVAAGSIIAALNLAKAAKVSIPFFFGGDGATLLIPAFLLDALLPALTEHRENTARNFNLDLRVGHMPVAEVYRKNYQLRIAKVKMSSIFSIPIVLGKGLQYAERAIKAPAYFLRLPEMKERRLDLEGMECRWDRVKPPPNCQEVVCLLIEPQSDAQQADIFRMVLEKIDEIYGSHQGRNPISVQNLTLDATWAKIKTEMQAKLGRFKFSYLLKNWLYTLFGKLYFQVYENGKNYLHHLVELSDTLVIDGRINTVISGTVQQRKMLEIALNQIESQGKIIYGLHVSKESIMSCYVRDRLDQHVHFVDGSEGGYTKAASMLKAKLIKG